MKPIILALETATHACSAALFVGEAQFCRFEITEKAHTQLLLPMIDSLLEEANLSRQEITAIAVGRGPGSFTGVRIAVSAAQGLGFGLNIPVYPISTLEALSMQIMDEPQINDASIICAIDARMHEVYAGVYRVENENMTLVQPEFICAPQDVLKISYITNIVAIGSGWDVYFDEIVSHQSNIKFLSNRLPNAKHIAMIAQRQIKQGVQGLKAENVLPVYIRDNVAKKSVA